jgi:hypothetical protein
VRYCMTENIKVLKTDLEASLVSRWSPSPPASSQSHDLVLRQPGQASAGRPARSSSGYRGSQGSPSWPLRPSSGADALCEKGDAFLSWTPPPEERR